MSKHVALVFALALLGVATAPVPVPSDPVSLLGLVGKSASALTFAPLGEAPRPLSASGKPTVVIAFASWCAGCIAEMPRNLADYAKYAGRVQFLGIDYSEPASVAKKMVAQYGIAFPVEAYDSGSAAGMQQAASGPHSVYLPNTMTEKELADLKGPLGKALYDKILAVYRARSTMSPSAFAAYEKEMGIYFEDPKQLAKDAATDKQGPTVLDLPNAFVIDARGVVVQAIEGYNPKVDEIALALAKLGI